MTPYLTSTPDKSVTFEKGYRAPVHQDVGNIFRLESSGSVRFISAIEFSFTAASIMIYNAYAVRQSIRWASARSAVKSDKITVQLLKDCLPLGIRGQIVRVKPAYMRNFLHVGNKACYVLDGQEPRIPVVEKPRVAPVPEVKTVIDEKPIKKDAPPVLSLDDLSSLFAKSRATHATESSYSQSFTAQAANSTYTLAELSDNLPGTFTIKPPALPVSRDFLASAVFNSTGIEIPPSSITVKNEVGENIAEIASPGSYSWAFQVPGQTGSLQRKLNIQ